MSFTLKEIADLAGVSPATVSLALNNKPGISPSTKERILEIIESVEKTNSANSFSYLRKGSIRFLKVVKHGHVVNRDHDVFIASYIEGMENEGRLSGFNIEVTSINLGQLQDLIENLESSSCKGLIVLGTELQADDLLLLETIKIPNIVIDTSYDFINIDFVDMNNTESVFNIIKYLADLNHKEIGLLWSDVKVRNFELRRTAFEQAIKFFKLPFRKNLIITVDSTYSGAYQGIIQYIDSGGVLPTALFSANDLMASACMRAFKEKGIRVPEDVSIIGFDNLPMCEMLDPPLTTMNVSKRYIGIMAMRLLAERINSTKDIPSRKISIGGNIVIRKSVKEL